MEEGKKEADVTNVVNEGPIETAVRIKGFEGEAWQIHSYESGVKTIERDVERVIERDVVVERKTVLTWTKDAQAQRVWAIEIAGRLGEYRFGRDRDLQDVVNHADKLLAYVNDGIVPEREPVEEDADVITT